jgi:hypothetical protein
MGRARRTSTTASLHSLFQEAIMAGNQGNHQNQGNSGGNEGGEGPQDQHGQSGRSDAPQGSEGNRQSASKPGQVEPPKDADEALSPDRTSSAGS